MIAVTLPFCTCLISRQPLGWHAVIVMLLQSLLHWEVKVTWLYECLSLWWPCHRKSPERHSTSMIDPKKYQGWEKKKLAFLCSGRVLVKEMKMRGSSEITHKLNDDNTECFIQWFENLQGHLAFESNRNSCGRCSYQIHNSGHLSTRDWHPYCTSRPFLQLHMLLHCLLGTPFSALLWYHSTWSSLLSSLDWPFHFRPVLIAKLLPIFHRRLNNTFYALNENISPHSL